MKKRLFSMMMIAIMLFSMLPMTTFAAHSHSWKESADKSYHFCSCGEKCYGSVTEEILVNCSNNQGEKVVKLGCTDCDYVRTGFIKSAGVAHEFNGGEKCVACGQPNPDYAPPCTQHDWKNADGKCTNFGCEASHVHEDTTPSAPKECGTGGYNTAEMCDTCGWMISTGTPVPATHNYVDGKCTVCGKEDPKCTAHTWGTDGKCNTDGCDAECPHTETELIYRNCIASDYDYYQCETCKKVTNNAVPQNRTAHNFGSDGKCTYCGAEDPKCAHEWKMGECTKCHTQHQHANTDMETKMPNCVEGGYISHKCKVCGYITIDNTPVDAGAHNFVGGVCTVCGQAQPAAGECEHEWTESPATGKCVLCGASCEHPNMKHTNNATCLAEGYETYLCPDCQVLEFELVGPLGHHMGEWYQTKAPTYTKDGEERRDCQREGCDFFETRPIEKLVYIEPTSPVGPNYYTITNEVKGLEVSHERAKAGQRIYMTLEDTLDIDEIIVIDSNDDELEIKEDDNGYYFVMPARNVTVTRELPSFIDVVPGAYYYDAVEWAVENGITNGMTATTFGPDLVCTRAQVVTFLWRAAGCPEPTSTVMPFVDVAPGAYYYDAVLWAVEKGITNGMTATTFAPNATVTRAQTVTFLWRSEGMEYADGQNVFVDVPADTYYTEAVQWAVENGITNGTSATTFSPANGCTRAQIVTFLYRLFN